MNNLEVWVEHIQEKRKCMYNYEAYSPPEVFVCFGCSFEDGTVGVCAKDIRAFLQEMKNIEKHSNRFYHFIEEPDIIENMKGNEVCPVCMKPLLENSGKVIVFWGRSNNILLDIDCLPVLIEKIESVMENEDFLEDII